MKMSAQHFKSRYLYAASAFAIALFVAPAIAATSDLSTYSDLGPSELAQGVPKGNSAAAHREHGAHRAAVVQHERNVATMVQSGSGNVATADQAGQGNIVSLRQDGSDNVAHLTQQGRGNDIELGQIGRGNVANITESGARNRTDVAQVGTQNLVQVQQYGFKQQFSVQQYGNGLTAKVTLY
jgi:minor curlin subunit